MKGKLIVVEGVDSSGKATHTQKLYERLLNEGYSVRKVEFPNYNSESSALIKMYLNGEFGSDPDDINPYIASTFYAVDRYASYKKEWGTFYKNGGIIVSDRYVTSNIIHQAAKIKNLSEKDNYLDWLWDLEFNKFRLPVPDCVVFLDMPYSYCESLMEKRDNKFTGKKQKDIHERNTQYLSSVYENAIDLSNRYKWERINCIKDGQIRTIVDIHEEIYSKIAKILPGK